MPNKIEIRCVETEFDLCAIAAAVEGYIEGYAVTDKGLLSILEHLRKAEGIIIVGRTTND